MLNKKNREVSVIGSGFSGLSAACYSAKAGCKVSVYEKNDQIGGRARTFSEEGFLFDMGPSWYWMPDIFEKFYSDFGKTTSDFYHLVKLDPGFQIFFSETDILEVPANIDELYALFEKIEVGSASKLKKFLAEAEFKYRIGMNQLVYKPALSWSEYMNFEVISGVAKSHVFKSLRTYVRNYFKDERLISLLEFPVLFLGAMPNQIPALYSLMNHAALTQGTYYPMGGMYKIVEAMKKIATDYGVEFHTKVNIDKIIVNKNTAVALQTNRGGFNTDNIIASADYHHIESLLDEKHRNYSEAYWNKKTFAPSCLIYYVGVNKKIKKLIHHNLFFDSDFETHSNQIYTTPMWPNNPLFYVCCPSKTDPSVAPDGMENLFILVPVATGLTDTEEIRNKYFDPIIKRIEKLCGDTFSSNIVYKKSYSVSNFISDYNSFKGNAYGLANTLSQTAVLKPSLKNKKINNLIYTGQLTVPGPGVPPAIISGQLAAELTLKNL
jgi:phytoene desaturase